MKSLHIVTSGTHLPPATLYLKPRTKPEAILKPLRLEYSADCYVIVSCADPSRDLFELEDLHSAVEDGQTLIVMTLSEFARL